MGPFYIFKLSRRGGPAPPESATGLYYGSMADTRFMMHIFSDDVSLLLPQFLFSSVAQFITTRKIGIGGLMKENTGHSEY